MDAIESFKDCASVSDDNTIRGMSILVTGPATICRQSAKHIATLWSDVITRLRNVCRGRRQLYKIYKELFIMEQREENTDLFISIAKARALLTKLFVGDLIKKVQRDMVYGLLNQRIRKRLRREECSRFADIISHTRITEDSIDESITSRSRHAQLRLRYHGMASGNPSASCAHARFVCARVRDSRRNCHCRIHQVLQLRRLQESGPALRRRQPDRFVYTANGMDTTRTYAVSWWNKVSAKLHFPFPAISAVLKT